MAKIALNLAKLVPSCVHAVWLLCANVKKKNFLNVKIYNKTGVVCEAVKHY